jgi:hypothetical protein
VPASVERAADPIAAMARFAGMTDHVPIWAGRPGQSPSGDMAVLVAVGEDRKGRTTVTPGVHDRRGGGECAHRGSGRYVQRLGIETGVNVDGV